MATTIQISEELRRELKALASYQDLSYDEMVEELIDVFEVAIPFQTEKEFAAWFEDNLDKFGFAEIIERRKRESPDYRLRTTDGDIQAVELELLGKHFRSHGHDPADTDLIISAFADTDEIDGVPVLAVISAESLREQVIDRGQQHHTTISLPTELHQDVDAFIADTGFQSVSEFAKFVLRDIASHHDVADGDYLTDGVQRVRERLQNLGYLDKA
jgi:Arc/MetJ-type ribon-helix-helix transcriptional regulator